MEKIRHTSSFLRADCVEEEGCMPLGPFRLLRWPYRSALFCHVVGALQLAVWKVGKMVLPILPLGRNVHALRANRKNPCADFLSIFSTPSCVLTSVAKPLNSQYVRSEFLFGACNLSILSGIHQRNTIISKQCLRQVVVLQLQLQPKLQLSEDLAF